jgi:hypothetical protein
MQRPKTKALDGNRWRRTHQATVDSVLHPIGEWRKVESRGHSFFNRDNWTARVFVAALCEWARLNPASVPDKYDVESWVMRANQAAVPESQKGITIASTPDDLPRWLAYALVGGGYHEAWHTVYSRRTRIHISEVWPKVRDLWDLVPYDPANGKMGWAGLTGAVLHWGNIIEDIRIERCGCKAYPGAPSKMEALQDLILQQEEEGRTMSEHRGVAVNDHLSVVVGTFRDLGLGYETPTQLAALRKYQERSPEGYRFVTEGPLKSFLVAAIEMGPMDDLGHLWMAMEIVAAIVKTTEPPEPEEQQEGESDEGDGDSGQGQGQSQGKQLKKDQLLLFKKGDRAKLKTGPHKGRTVEVVKASLPHPETGVQKLEFALVEGE